MRLVTTEIEAMYTVTRPFRAPFHRGGLLHGLLGWALREVACAEPSRCAGPCARPGQCAWSRLYAPPPREPPPHRLLAHVPEPPGPVVLRVPSPAAANLAPGDTFSFRLRLFGADAESDVAVLERALASVTSFPIGREEGHLELSGPVFHAPPREHVIAPGDARTTRLTVHFETPVRMKRESQPTKEIDFALLFSTLWRRLTMLCALYGHYGAADDEAFEQLRAVAPTIRTVSHDLRPLQWEHLSTATGERKVLRGLLGHIVFEGNLGLFLPALAGGEVVHVGGATGFGLGRMRVEMS